MSLRNKLFSVAGVALATAALSTFTVAQDSAPTKTEKAGNHERGEGRGFRRGGFAGKGAFGRDGHGRGGFGLRGINLTDAQKAQIKTIMQGNKPVGSLREQFKTLAEARRSGTLTAEQKASLKGLRDQMKAKRSASHAQILAVLTPEQRAELDKRKSEMKERREQFRENRQNRRREFRKGVRPGKVTTDKPDTI